MDAMFAPRPSAQARCAARRAQGALIAAAWIWGAVVAAARPAQAGLLTLSASVGSGFELHPLQAEQSTNLMLTPGLSLLGDMLRLELGVLGAWGAVRGGQKDALNLELRPMLRAKLLLLPIYGRLIVAGLDLTSQHPQLAYGGAAGVALSAFGLGIFGEVGVLPRHLSDGLHWIAEARLGASYAF